MKSRTRTILCTAVATTALVGAWRYLNRKDVPLEGSLLGIPYDLRWPTPAVLRERFWNPEDPRVFTPHVLGWGWSVNFYTVGRKLGLLS